MAKIQIVEVDAAPLCPHCREPLDTIEKVSKGTIEQHVLYSCPYCKKLLSIGFNIGY